MSPAAAERRAKVEASPIRAERSRGRGSDRHISSDSRRTREDCRASDGTAQEFLHVASSVVPSLLKVYPLHAEMAVT